MRLQEMTASVRRGRSSDTRGATASGEERTLLPSNAEDHTGTRNVEPTAPPEEDTIQEEDPPAISAATREGQSSASQDSVHAAEPQQTADQPASSTAAREGQSSASQDSVHAAESQQMVSQPAISRTATRVGPTSVSQDSVHAAESVQMQAQPTVISSTTTTEGQSSAGLDSVDTIVAGRNQHTSIGHHTVPTSHGTPASTVPSAPSEQHPPMSQQTLAPVEAQPASLPTSHGTPASTVPSASNEQHSPMSQQPLAPAEAQPASLPTSHGTPASTVPLASNEQHPSMNQQPLAPVEAQPPARNPPPDASSTASRSDSEPQNPNKRVTEEHMGKLASLILDWQRLAILLGISRADINDLKADNSTEWNRKYAMLCGWLSSAYKEATVGFLFIKCQEAKEDVKVYDYLLNI